MRYLLLLVAAILLSPVLKAQRKKEDGFSNIPAKYFGATLSIPLVHNINFYDYETGKNKSSTQFIGLEGYLFFKDENYRIAVGGGLLTSAKKPFPYAEEKTLTTGPQKPTSWHFDILYYRKVTKRLNAIGGLNLQDYRYHYVGAFYSDDVYTESYTKNDKGLGLALGGEYSISPIFAPAIIYRPVLVPFNSKRYFHAISLDLKVYLPFVRFKPRPAGDKIKGVRQRTNSLPQ